MFKIINTKYYEDVTKEWLSKSTKKIRSHKVLIRKYYFYNNKKYYVLKNKKDVVLDYSTYEYMIAQWIKDILGGKIYINPRINYPKSIKTADYLWNNELWDLKCLKQCKSLNRAVDNSIKSSKNQSHNFILDISGCILSNDNIIQQVTNTFTPGKLYRDWVNIIIIIRNKKIIKIIKKRGVPSPFGQGKPLS